MSSRLRGRPCHISPRTAKELRSLAAHANRAAGRPGQQVVAACGRPCRDVLRLCRHCHARGGACPGSPRAGAGRQACREARAAASDLGLVARVDEVGRPDPKVPAGHVLGQDPPPGASARRQRSIRVWVSAGPRIVVAPKLVGESERAAQIRLTQDGRHRGHDRRDSRSRLPARMSSSRRIRRRIREPPRCGCWSIAARIASATSCPI